MQASTRDAPARPPRYQAPRFRRNEEQGWFVVGPAFLMQLGPVKVYRKNGSAKTVTVKRLGQPFESHGFEYIPGFLRE